MPIRHRLHRLWRAWRAWRCHGVTAIRHEPTAVAEPTAAVADCATTVRRTVPELVSESLAIVDEKVSLEQMRRVLGVLGVASTAKARRKVQGLVFARHQLPLDEQVCLGELQRLLGVLERLGTASNKDGKDNKDAEKPFWRRVHHQG